MSAELSGARQALRAVAETGGWPWCDEHQAPQWHGAFACAPRHHDAVPGGPGWCFTCERMHKPMEWGEGCQDWQDVRAAEIEAEVTGHERTARRYRRASKTVEAAAGVLVLAMAGVLLAGDGPTTSSIAAGLLLAAIAVYLCSWPLQRRSADARMQAMETRWEASRERREGDRG